MQVVLIHGMGRTAWSMLRLKYDLQRSGHRVHLLGYAAAIEPFGRISQRLRRRLAVIGASGSYVLVTHSLGGVLARQVLGGGGLPSLHPPAHLIMLGTPNQPPRMARRFRRHLLYRWVNGECGQLLATADFYAGLSPLTVPYTIVAGTSGNRWSAPIFGGDPNDGLVSVSETLVAGDDTPVVLPARHTFMMNDRRVRAVIKQILETLAVNPLR